MTFGFDCKSENGAAIVGETGSIIFDSWFHCSEKVSLYDSNNRLIETKHFPHPRTGYEYEITEVSRCLNMGLTESPLVPHSGTREVMVMIDRIKKIIGLSYPDENSFDAVQEGAFLQGKTESKNEIEIIAVVDGVTAGMAGIEAIGSKYKVRHRADFGISVDKQFWGLGIGSELMNACIECARKAGYVQLELNVVAENEKAISLYKKAGFVEYGRNPKGFNSRTAGFQELIFMRLEL